MPTATLTCPKCAGAMRQYERNGVTVDQCADCRGVFLDRGELERLVDAETSFYKKDDDRGRYESADRYDRHERSSYDHKKKRRGSFLSELFDS